MKRHVSDHSAINHQHQVALLIIKMVSCSPSASLPDPVRYCLQMLEKNLRESMQVLHSSGSGGHASLWALRRLWVQTLLQVLVPGSGLFQVEKQVEKERETERRIAMRKEHGFNICFGSQTNISQVTESVTDDMPNDSETLLYYAGVQHKALDKITANFNDAKVTGERDSYIGLSSSFHTGNVVFSAIEVALDLSRLLEDGITYALPASITCSNMRHKVTDTGTDDECGNVPSDNVNIDDYGKGGDDDRGRDLEEDDEVTASLLMHSARLSSLMQRLPTSCNKEGVRNTGNVLVLWLFQFLSEELLFCGTCITTSGWYTSNCWDPKKQKTCAFEYIIYIVYQVS